MNYPKEIRIPDVLPSEKTLNKKNKAIEVCENIINISESIWSEEEIKALKFYINACLSITLGFTDEIRHDYNYKLLKTIETEFNENETNQNWKKILEWFLKNYKSKIYKYKLSIESVLNSINSLPE